ncbi:hypothetical protein MTP99_016125 [Tenebrio molitor]|jgi:hypothetical protein|nr:hypothetical protein MTP99_016125 [Tenebrio molitor]
MSLHCCDVIVTRTTTVPDASGRARRAAPRPDPLLVNKIGGSIDSVRISNENASMTGPYSVLMMRYICIVSPGEIGPLSLATGTKDDAIDKKEMLFDSSSSCAGVIEGN